MQIDIVIPVTRPQAVLLALESLASQTRAPDLVTLVTNELSDPLPPVDLALRVLGFRSEHYPVGHLDVALRRNIGIFFSPCTHVMTFDDDQVAPRDLVEHSARLLARKRYFWGHHRFIAFADRTVQQLQALDPVAGRPREHPPNSWHLWASCYGGLFGAQTDLLRNLGGYDMIFCGRHAGEDQNLGRRLARRIDRGERVYIHEPPFAWHPEERLPWAAPVYTNVCRGDHELVEMLQDGARIEACRNCPYFRALDSELFRDEVVMLFDPRRVHVEERRLSG